MVYNIHVTPESLPNYIENPNDFISLYTLNRIESFELQPTLRLLKKYNGIYFFFFECPEQVEDDKNHKSVQDVSSSTNSNRNSFIRSKNNNTKRIHIHSLKKKQNHGAILKKKTTTCLLTEGIVRLAGQRKVFLVPREYIPQFLESSQVVLLQVHPSRHCLKA
jgi:hypothetical protein